MFWGRCVDRYHGSKRAEPYANHRLDGGVVSALPKNWRIVKLRPITTRTRISGAVCGTTLMRESN